MTTPGLTLWTFDGPPEYPSDSDPLTPPPYGRPRNLAPTAHLEGIVRYSATEQDDDEFHDAPTTPDAPIWTRYDKGKGKALPSGPSTPPATPPKSAAQKILRGEHHVATFGGTSQYSRGGSSTCGLASLNAIRLAFDLYGKIANGEELVAKLVSEEFVEDVMGIAAWWPDRAHLEIEPILELPMFSNAFQVLDVQYRELRYRTFSDLLLSLIPEKGSTGPRAACLTRTPEIIAIVHMPITGLDNNSILPTYRRRVDSIYLIFDSHPRPNHPNGAGIQVFASDPIADVADYLMDLFQFDEKLVNDPHLEWQAQLLGQVSYHVLAPTETRNTLNEYELNMRFLALHQKVAETKQNLDDEQAQKREAQRRYFALEQEVGLLNRGKQRMRDEIEELKTALKRASPRESNTYDNSWGWRDDFTRRNVKGKGRDHGHDPSSNLSWRSDRGGSSESEFSSWQKAPDWPRALPAIPSRPSGSRPSGSKPSGSQPSGSQSGVVPAASRRYTAEPSILETPNDNAQDLDTTKSLELAMAMQREFDQEREAFALDASLAQALERPKFDCSICTDSFTDEDIAIVDGCNHSCCRGCMRDLIQSQIEQRRYPIPCPFCAADSSASNPPGRRRTIQAWLVETIGISAELFEIFVEMQLAEHSVLVNCRKCSGSAFIDRRDYDSIKVVTCPVAGCTHSWCKQCNQTIEDQVKHSCDGSAELESLMGQRGWKHCPGCRTPIERTSGCNSMTCRTPGCNMNFCYQCGGARGGRAGAGVPGCSC